MNSQFSGDFTSSASALLCSLLASFRQSWPGTFRQLPIPPKNHPAALLGKLAENLALLRIPCSWPNSLLPLGAVFESAQRLSRKTSNLLLPSSLIVAVTVDSLEGEGATWESVSSPALRFGHSPCSFLQPSRQRATLPLIRRRRRYQNKGPAPGPKLKLRRATR